MGWLLTFDCYEHPYLSLNSLLHQGLYVLLLSKDSLVLGDYLKCLRLIRSESPPRLIQRMFLLESLVSALCDRALRPRKMVQSINIFHVNFLMYTKDSSSSWCYSLPRKIQHILPSSFHFHMPTHFGSTLDRHMLLIGLSSWNFPMSTSSFLSQCLILSTPINLSILRLIFPPTTHVQYYQCRSTFRHFDIF